MDIMAAVSHRGAAGFASDRQSFVVQPFIAAVSLAFAEMTGTEVVSVDVAANRRYGLSAMFPY